MKLLSDNTLFTATTLAGLEEVCANELAGLGGRDVTVLKRAVSFTGDRDLMYRANYQSRLALRILLPLTTIPFKDAREFYYRLNAFAWEEVMGVDQTFAIDAVGTHPAFNNTLFAAQKCKDALADRFRKLHGRRPSVNLDQPDIRIHLHLTAEQATMSLDSSGEPLFKRGYRKASVPAPLNEVLAAGLIALASWDAETPLFDPFCGSGTIAIEAAMIAARVPAGTFREHWCFMNWPDFDAAAWTRIKADGASGIRTLNVPITASDIDERNLGVARRNIAAAGFAGQIKTACSPFETFAFPEGPGFIVTNPPYGERLREFDQIDFYKKVGDTLKRNCAGFVAWIIGSDQTAVKYIGLKPEKKFTVFNGQLECKYLRYSIFSGSRKAHLGAAG